MPKSDHVQVFDDVAEQYAATRPSYPVALIEDLALAARLKEGSRILEIGAGPGIATALFAHRGYRITALEPGPRLAAIARQRLSDDSAVEVLQTTFEEWPLEAGAFELVFAAQAFHWIDPAVAFQKSADALGANGTLAVIAHRPVLDDSAVGVEIQAAYAAHAPGIDANPARSNTLEVWAPLFEASGRFEPARVHEMMWRTRYSTEGYLSLLATFSPHLSLEPGARARLFQAIAAAIERQGGSYVVGYVAMCCFAAVSARAPAERAESQSRPTRE
jgi:SAM-dependent methyltransferase